MADEAKATTAAEATKQPEPKAAPAPKAKKDDGPQEITVVTTGQFQLYDMNTRTVFPPKKKVDVLDNNPFVITHLKRGNLKKV